MTRTNSQIIWNLLRSKLLIRPWGSISIVGLYGLLFRELLFFNLLWFQNLIDVESAGEPI